MEYLLEMMVEIALFIYFTWKPLQLADQIHLACCGDKANILT